MATLDNLGSHSDGTTMTAGQAQKEVTSNALDNLLSNATQKLLDVAIADAGSPTSADRTLSDDEFFGSYAFRLTGTPSVAFTLTVQTDGHHLFAVLNATGRTCTVSLGSGATVDVPNGAFYVLHSDTSDIRQVTGLLGTPYDFGATFEIAPADGAVFQRIPIARTILIPADFSGSFGAVDTNPGEQFDIDVRDDGSSIGTISVSTGGTFTFTTTNNTAKNVASGSVVTFVAPSGSPSEVTVAGLAVGISATVAA